MLEKKRLSYLPVAALSAFVLVVAATVAGPRPAHAAFPGANGKIAFTRQNNLTGDSVYVMNLPRRTDEPPASSDLLSFRGGTRR